MMKLIDLIHQLLATAQANPALQQQQCDATVIIFNEEGKVTWTLDSEKL